MCLGLPMQIVEMTGTVARCTRGGVERDVDLFLLQGQDVAVGDCVLVHVGYAIQKIDTAAAEAIWALVKRMEGTGDA